MNERIKELAEQVAKESELYYVNKFDLNKDTNKFFAEVFAELIVQECMTTVVGAPIGVEAKRKIEKHFGVE